jgi:hypothetical protein
MSWKEVLAQARPGDHVAQVYQDAGFLMEAVCHYVGSGLQQGEGVLLIMREANRNELERRLQAAGADPTEAIARGQLHFYEASEMLGRLMKGGMPDGELFRHLIGGALTQVRWKYPDVRAFGELVDILWQRGHRLAAQHLEELWNDFIRDRGFSMFCAYSMDPLSDFSYGGPLENVCKAHTHLIPARHYDKLDAAVKEASKQVLDRQLAGMLNTLASTHRSSTAMPLGQATLMWLKDNMPRTSDRILNLVRARYTEA